MTDRFLRRTMILAAAVAVASAVPAIAQYRIDNGAARDANNRIGSGGFNDRNTTVNGGLNGNLIVTGNVANGRSFRGALGYTDQYSFRGDVGSGSFDRFNRDSVGIGQLRGMPNSIYNNQGVTTVRPYFGGGQTVTPPPGYVQDATTGGFVLQRPRIVQPSDARIDYGGASRAQVTDGLLSQQTTIGGAGLAANGTTPTGPRDLLGQPLSGSEYTTLARPAARIGLLEQANQRESAPNIFTDPRDPKAPGNAGPLEAARNAEDAASGSADGIVPNGQNGRSPDNQNAIPPGGAQLAAPGQGASQTGATGQPLGQKSGQQTGQQSSVRDLRAMQNNSQYAALRQRLNQRQQSNSGLSARGVDAIEQSNDRNREVLARRQQTNDAAGDTTAAGMTNTGGPNANAPKTGPQAPGGMNPGLTRLPTNGAGATPPANPTPGATPAPQAGTPEPTVALPPRSAENPVEIRSLAAGIQDVTLRESLEQAEQLLKNGKFTSAIDAFDRAERLASDDPLVFVGRGIAELGGGYYRPAERHLRQALTADQSLMFARFDLREMLTPDRVNFVLEDLGRVANANKNDPGPLLLLAFVYYNANVPDRAARALELAQERAGGKDATVKLLQENWTLPATRPAADVNK